MKTISAMAMCGSTSTCASRLGPHFSKRTSRQCRRIRPPDTKITRLPDPKNLLQLSLLIVCLCLSTIPYAAAQTTTTASSLTTTSTSSTISASSTSAATPTYSISTVPTTLSLPPLNTSSPIYQLSLPNVPSLLLTLSICSLTSNTSVIPTVLISTADPPTFNLGSKSVSDSSSGGVPHFGWNRRSSKTGTTWEITWDQGFGNWTYTGTGEAQVSILMGLGLGADGTLDDDDGVDGSSAEGNVVIQLGASSSAPVHALTPVAPLLGDTTQTSALIFSPLLLSSPQIQPNYPNYTLPGNQLVFTSLDNALSTSLLNSSLSSNLTLIIIPASSSPTNDGLDNAYCAISQSINSTGNVASDIILQSDQPQWMSVGGEEGYRSYWVIGDLISQTNYTAWVRDSSGVLSSPMWFTTKEDTFPCQLVMPTSLCPSIGYSAPLSANETSTGTGTGITSPIQVLPDEITQVLTSQLEAFSTSLLSQACGRDLYSHVSTCLDCYSAYRDWLCRIVIPRCGSTNSSSSSSSSSTTTAASTNGLPLPSTILRTTSTPRNSNSLLNYSYEYTELLPCLSTCNAVDRTCPSWLGFRCPARSVNAARSYAFSGKDESKGDGSSGSGVPAYDKWGNRWCNG